VSNCALLLLVCACRNASPGADQTRLSSAPATLASEVPPHPLQREAVSPRPELAPLQAPWLVELGGADDGVVAPPVGEAAPRRIVVGVHGAGDRPEWSCGGWRLAAQASVFVACPRGTATSPTTFAWPSAAALTRKVDAIVAQVRQRFGPYVAEGPLIYAGFSQGATLSEPLLLSQAARFPIAILAEGGYATARSAAFARRYRAAGGRRLVLVCGTPACFAHARRATPVLERAGLETLVVGDPKAGHNLNDRMQRALQAAWPSIAAPPEAEAAR
jgi:predicted esterase